MNGRQKCILGLKRKRSNQCDHPQCPAVRQERDIYEFDEEDDEPVPNKFCRTQKLKRKPQKKEWPIIKPVANKVSQRREKKYTIRVKNPRNAPICPKLSAAIGPSSSTNKILENLLKINSKKSKVVPVTISLLTNSTVYHDINGNQLQVPCCNKQAILKDGFNKIGLAFKQISAAVQSLCDKHRVDAINLMKH